jgi:ABC-type phosphate/phosphonate transport system substrate-binding protein
VNSRSERRSTRGGDRRAALARWLAAAALALTWPAPHAAAAGDGYVFGVLPFLVPARVGEAFSPVARSFAAELGVAVRLETSSDLGTLVGRLDAGRYDIVLMDPVSAVRLIDDGLYVPFARRPSRAAAVVVPQDSAIRTPQDLRGRIIGLTPAGSPLDVFVTMALDEQGLRRDRDYQRKRLSPGACLHGLLVGTVEACATGGGASLNAFERAMKVTLHQVLRTAPFPHMVFATHISVPEAGRKALQDTTLAWPRSASGRKLLDGIGPDAVFIPYLDGDCDLVREAVAAARQHEASLD